MRATYDVLVIGGGINGVGIAADAAGRGLTTLLCEMNDLGSATSSSSSKLVHGGLRYLENFEFRLVQDALAEREVLLQNAPHIAWPLRFRLPYRHHLRPAWLIRLGLFLYDHLARRVTSARSRRITLDKHSPLKPGISRCFEYSDGWVDDARLVILNAMAARAKGADILPRTRCISAQRHGEHWRVRLQDQRTGESAEVGARALVNATGPWVTHLLQEVVHTPPPRQIRLVKGSHIIVPRLHDGAEAYILQNDDGRIVFVIPYEERFSLIGTTDVEYQGDPSDVQISQEEREYLITVTNQHFRHQILPADIVWSYSGVRPLLDDHSTSAQAVTRDYTFEWDVTDQQAPLLSVFGGKITTYRKLAQTAVDKLSGYFPQAGPGWTENAPLPGGEFDSPAQLQQTLSQHYPWLTVQLLKRYVRSYGTLCHQFLQGHQRLDDLGEHFGQGLYAAEVDYLIRQEWACSCEDILWRRSKLGLHLHPRQIDALRSYLNHHPDLKLRN